jgi:hypothetical protein
MKMRLWMIMGAIVLVGAIGPVLLAAWLNMRLGQAAQVAAIVAAAQARQAAVNAEQVERAIDQKPHRWPAEAHADQIHAP